MANKYHPDKWVLVKLPNSAREDDYRVFGTWAGSYLHGDSWRMNSGVKSFEEAGGDAVVGGESGSQYFIRLDSYGTTLYGSSVLATLARDYGVRVLLEDEALEILRGCAKKETDDV